MKSLNTDMNALHFVGIGGIGMSGIAEVLNQLGYTVQGSDLSDSANVKRLREKGMHVSIGHAAANLKDEAGNLPEAIVVSSAIKQDNPELVEARALKIPVVRRAEMLAELMRLKTAVAVAGTHGKTTTTSMVGEMLGTGEFDPTVINGGIVNRYGTNTRLGKSEWMVVEADESDGTFTRLPATVGIVTNMDPEHMEHYGTFENVRAAYRQFVDNLPFYGYAVMCLDHPEVQSLVAEIHDRKVITYGFSPQADVHASNVRFTAEGSLFDVKIAAWLCDDGRDLDLRDVHLPMFGNHNVQNSLVALAIGHEMGMAVPLLKKGLAEFGGVKRRFTKTGTVNGITIIDDYAHHPKEIETVLKAARQALGGRDGKVISVMQPHRFSRLHDLFEEFCTCFNEADSVLIADVYRAGEDPIEGADRDALVAGIAAHGHKHVAALETRETLAKQVAGIARENDIVICMGAGDITAWAYALPEELKGELDKKSSAA